MNLVKFDTFTDEARTGLDVAMGEDAEQIIDEVCKGISQLYQVNDVSWLVTRIDVFGDKPELVLVCYQGENVLTMVNWLAGVAREKGIKSLRCHTKNKQFARVIENRIGADLLEYVYKLEL